MATEKPIAVDTCIQNSATAIAKGQAVIMNAVADNQQVVISTANAAKPKGIALEASPGQNKAFPVVTLGLAKGKAGGTVTQGQYAESDASGNLINHTTGSIRKVLGRFMDSGVSGDYVTVWVFPGEFWV